MISCEKSNMVSLASQVQSRFPVKYIFSIAFGLVSSACSLLISIAIML